MAVSVRFKLKNDLKLKEKLIFLYFNHGEYSISRNGNRVAKPFKYSTSEKIDPIYWDKKLEKPTKKHDTKFGVDITNNLEFLKSVVKGIYRAFQLEGTNPTNDMLREKMNEKLRGSKKVIQSEYITDFIQEYIKSNKNKTITKRKAKSTIQKYTQLRDKILFYEANINKRLSFTSITEEIYLKFFTFCNTIYIEETGRSYSENTIHHLQKNFKKFLNLGKKKYKIQFDFTDEELIYPETDVDDIYLTFDEIKLIMNTNINYLPKSFKRALDTFVLMALSGIRVGDLKEITKTKVIKDTDINNNPCYYATYKQGKGNKGLQVTIPIFAPVLKMYIENENQFPKFLSANTININIKRICRLAKIGGGEMITKENKLFNNIETISTEKYNLITNHTARRSFVTNSISLMIPELVWSKITHPKERKTVSEKYDKLSNIENVKLYFQYVRLTDNTDWLLDYK